MSPPATGATAPAATPWIAARRARWVGADNMRLCAFPLDPGLVAGSRRNREINRMTYPGIGASEGAVQETLARRGRLACSGHEVNNAR